MFIHGLELYKRQSCFSCFRYSLQPTACTVCVRILTWTTFIWKKKSFTETVWNQLANVIVVSFVFVCLLFLTLWGNFYAESQSYLSFGNETQTNTRWWTLKTTRVFFRVHHQQWYAFFDKMVCFWAYTIHLHWSNHWTPIQTDEI